MPLVTPPTRRPGRRSAAPTYWSLLFQELFGTSPTLAAELWEAWSGLYPENVQSLHFHLQRMVSPGPLATIEARIQHFDTLLPPLAVFAASLALAPEGTGTNRRADIVRFEETVLRHVDRHGAWRAQGGHQ